MRPNKNNRAARRARAMNDLRKMYTKLQIRAMYPGSRKATRAICRLEAIPKQAYVLGPKLTIQIRTFK